MSKAAQEIVSAQVILRPASGKPLQGPVTSENVRKLLPSADALALVLKAFVDTGFKVGPVVANTFSISGPVSTFNKVFKTRIQGGIASGQSKPVDYELPLKGLPREVASLIEAATFAPPPDFGPSSY